MRLLLLVLMALGWSAAARAHDGLPVAVTIEQRAADLYLMNLVLPPSVPEYIRPATALTGCEPARRGTAEASLTAEPVLYRCPQGLGGKALELSYRSGKPAVPTLARIIWQSGETRSVLAEPGVTRIALPSPESAGGVFLDYLRLGVDHILEGWDNM